jgi:opacity protein-like surface antigen
VPKLGLGAEYNLTKTVAVRAEYERYFNVGDKNQTGESDVGVWNVGVKMSF